MTKKQKDGSLCNVGQQDDDDEIEECGGNDGNGGNGNESMLQGKCFLLKKIKNI